MFMVGLVNQQTSLGGPTLWDTSVTQLNNRPRPKRGPVSTLGPPSLVRIQEVLENAQGRTSQNSEAMRGLPFGKHTKKLWKMGVIFQFAKV